MKRVKLIAPVLAVACLSFVAGCGSDKRESSTPQQVMLSQACIGCHAGTSSHVTGTSVVTEYLRSAHARSAFGAGCDNCHNVDGHPANGTIPPLPSNTICVTCHTNLVPMSTQAAHFSDTGASYTGLPLSRVGDTIINPATGDRSSSSCNACHNPHDPSSLIQVNRQWAQSGHGAVQDETFNEDPFIKSTNCSRCHTATGFRYYMTHNQTPITAAILGRYSSAKEAISCNACHTNYSWKRLSSDPSVTNFANFSTPYRRFPGIGKNFPGNLTAGTVDLGDTDICIPCHAGRTGRTGASVTPGTGAPFDSHYFAAAAVMYGKIAFINFTSLDAPIGTTTYGKTLITSDDIAGGVTSTHRRLGTSAIIGDHGITASQTQLTSNGPCVVCHMAASGHTLEINAAAFNNVCVNCHDQEGTTQLTANNFATVFIEENRELQNNALALAVKLLNVRYGIGINLTDEEIKEDPQDVTFVDLSNGNAIGERGAQLTNWNAYVAAHPMSATELYKLKGAIFNISLYYKENAAFVHARTITRRTIYDTIDFLDDGRINLSAGAAALGPIGQTVLAANGTPAFGKGATAYTDNTLSVFAPGTTASMTYLIGFNRGTGAWTPIERP